MMIKFNYYMLLEANPWPFIVSLNAMNFLMSMIFFMSNFTNFLLTNMLILVMTSVMWFKDINTESNMNGSLMFNLENSMKFFFILFILSEIMVFVSMFWSYYCFFLVSEMEMSKWPGFNLKTFEWDLMPMVNTIILISSSMTLTVSHWFMNSNSKKFTNFFMILTIFLGFMFTFLQFKEYQGSYYSINDGNFGSIFFLLTGLHGFHVIIGTTVLLCCYLKISNFDNNISSSESFEMGAWYWHFVDLVWIFVIYSLYYLN